MEYSNEFESFFVGAAEQAGRFVRRESETKPQERCVEGYGAGLSKFHFLFSANWFIIPLLISSLVLQIK